MDEAAKLPKSPRPFLAGFWLIAAIPAFLLVGFVMDRVIHMGTDFSDAGFFTAGVLTHFGAGYLWARALLRRTGHPASVAANAAAGLGLGFFVMGGYFFLPDVIDKMIDLFAFRGHTHLEFGTYFVPWTGLVAGGTGLFLGLGLRRWRLGVKLLFTGFACGVAAFSALAYLMAQVGFTVGVARTDGIPSMPVVSLLGFWATALLGSGLFGRLLMREKGSMALKAGASPTPPVILERTTE